MAALRVLPDCRDELVAERTATASRIHIDLAWSRPGYQLELPALTKAKQLRAALTLIEADEGMRARVTRQRLRPMLEITD
jgi:transposase